MLKDFTKIMRQYAAPYKGHLAGAVVLNILSAVFNIFSFALLVPILNILFRVDSTVYEFIPWDSDKIFVEGCPDDRNVWSYIIDINTKEAIQLPTNEGLIAIDPGKREIHMSHYLYHPEGGRYSVERVYTLDGKFTGKEYRIPD